MKMKTKKRIEEIEKYAHILSILVRAFSGLLVLCELWACVLISTTFILG